METEEDVSTVCSSLAARVVGVARGWFARI